MTYPSKTARFAPLALLALLALCAGFVVQASFVEADPIAALVTSTDSYGNSDSWHYDTAGYLDLGEQFAKALISVEKGHSK